MNKFLFIDQATTGKNPDRCAIYRIGGIYAEDGVEKKRFEFRMRPFLNARISEESLWICGESRSSLLIYRDERDVFKEFVGLLDTLVNVRSPQDKLYIAGYSPASYEVPFLTEWFRRNGNEHFRHYFHYQSIDVMCLAAVLLMNRRHLMPDFTLESAARHLGIMIPHTDSYNCIINAKASLDIYREFERRAGLGDCRDTAPASETVKNF